MYRFFVVGVLLFATLPTYADVHLLGSPQVRRELGIEHPLAVRIVGNLNEAARLNRGGVMTMEEAGQLEIERKRTSPEHLENQIMTWLSPAQKQRLEQLELQRGEPFIFEDWRFAQRVGLSRQQHQQLQPTFRRAFQHYVTGINRLMKTNASWYGRLDRKRYASKYAAHERAFEQLGTQRKEIVEMALNRTLTSTQKSKWRAILGEPFRERITYDTRSYPMN